MRLENLQLSRAGLRLNQTVELSYPEERMAARLVERLGLRPPIDVEKLCAEFADVTVKSFPIEIDGLCLDLKVRGKRPKIWISRSIAHVRKRFTLAHELGHIIIPWHSGTIVDDIESPRSGAQSRYRTMEAEANRFAAELLMPSSWVIGMAERAEHNADLMHSVAQIADVSVPAAFLRAARWGRPGYIGAEVRDGIIVRAIRTSETESRVPERGSAIANLRMPAAGEPIIIPNAETSYYWWKIKDEVPVRDDDLPPWRDILDEMLEDIPSDFRRETRASVNAIIGRAIGREPRGASVNRIYKCALEAFQNRQNESYWVKAIFDHRLFDDYMLARSKERSKT